MLARLLNPLVERTLARMERRVRVSDHERTVERLRPWLAKSWRDAVGEDRDFAQRAARFIASNAVGPDDFRQLREALGPWPLADGEPSQSPDSWFVGGKLLPGGANELRKQLRTGSEPAVCFAERLLLRVEVTRSVCVRDDGLFADERLLEKALVSLVLMEAGEFWSDLRFLNTALKTVDWLWPQVRRLPRRSPTPQRLQAGLMYIYVFQWQQEQLARL